MFREMESGVVSVGAARQRESDAESQAGQSCERRARCFESLRGFGEWVGTLCYCRVQ